MADYSITVTVSDLSYQSWLRTSYFASSIVSQEGTPMIVGNELGPDQKDAFQNFFEEAAREVLQLFAPRQGDVAGVPFTISGLSVIYVIAEQEPVLTHAASIKETLESDVKEALFLYVTILWLKTKGHADQVAILLERYSKIADRIDINLYKLHD